MSVWLKWVLLGFLSVLFGLFALNHAVLTSMAVTTIVGALFVVAGGAQILAGFSAEGSGAKVLGMAVGGLMALLGLSFLTDPLAGTFSLALLVTVFIFLGGLLRLFFAWRMKGGGFFWVMLGSGALSVGLALYIFANPALTVSLLGILLGIEFLFNGVGLVAFGLFTRRRGKPL